MQGINFERQMKEAYALVNTAYPSWVVDQMSVIQVQYEYGRLLAARYKPEPKPIPSELAGLHYSGVSASTRAMLHANECHVVYHFYSTDNRLLYIGRTNNFITRWRSHHAEGIKDMALVDHIDLHIFETKAETMFYEAQQIARKQPPQHDLLSLSGFLQAPTNPESCRACRQEKCMSRARMNYTLPTQPRSLCFLRCN